MGLFDRFKKPGKAPKEPPPLVNKALWAENLTEIARLISDGDEAVLEELRGCITDPRGYFDAHRERYAERNVANAGDPAQIQWLAMVDLLEVRSHVCERDWKDEKEDFLYFLQHLSGTKRLGLELQADWLDENGDILAWCAVLAQKWSRQNCRVAAIGIGSDSYVLFPCQCGVLARLSVLAEQLGQCIE